MNHYTFSQLSIGFTESFSVAITEQMLQQFCEITGDINPLHCNEAYAKENGFPGRVVYGMLTSAMYSTLAGVHLPGENSLLYAVDIKLRKPVFIGDTLTITGTVSDKNEACQLIFVKAVITNANGEKVSKATLEIGIRKTEP